MRTWAEYLAFLGFQAVFYLLPRAWCRGIGRSFGGLLFRLDARHRRRAITNLAIAFGRDKSPAEIRKIARASFRRFGETVADISKIFRLGKDKAARLVDVEGWENLAEAVGRGRGVLIFSAHMGNWEMGPALVSRLAKFNVIARRLDNPLIEKWLVRFRRAMGAEVIYKQQAARKIIQALRNKEAVAILVDQNVLRSEAVFVDFFGRPAGTTPALGAFHLRTGAPLVPSFCLRAPGGRHRMIFKPALEVPNEGDVSANVLKITLTCTKMIESEIRKDPASWLWVHDRWRSRPKGEHDHQDETA
jgi:Kdo2-lipid IVA lauroyltransferase/acyltransferase